jgi:hypothetical protein
MYWGHLEVVLLLYKELLYNSSLLSLLEFCSAFTSCVHCICLVLLCYFRDLVHNIWYRSEQSLVWLLQMSRVTIFLYNFLKIFPVSEIYRVHRGHSEAHWVKILGFDSL